MSRLRVVSVLMMSCAALGACAPAPPLIVHSSRVGQVSEPELGEPGKFERITDASQEGHPPGAFALHSTQEWDLFFADAKKHPRAPNVDWSKETVVALYSKDQEAVSVAVQRTIEAANGTHLYALEMLPGQGCHTPRMTGAFELVKIPRKEKPVHVHIDRDRGEPCEHGARPDLKLVCRVVKDEGAGPWQASLKVTLGTTVECDGVASSTGRPILERTLGFSDIAKGSGAKLVFKPDQVGRHGRFTVDAIGRYRVRFETRDDHHTKEETFVTVDVPPPDDSTYVATAWSQFSAADNVETFPRVELHARDASNTAQDCTYESTSKPAFCQVTRWNVTLLTRLRNTPPGRYQIDVKYTDERPQRGPSLCVRSFTKGVLVDERCDPAARKAGDKWSVGVLDETTGKLTNP